MNIKLRIELINKLRDFSGRLAILNKEIASIDVPGLMLVRQDLEGPKRRKKNIAYGQKHQQPLSSNRVTPPSGMGIHSDSPIVGPFYQECNT